MCRAPHRQSPTPGRSGRDLYCAGSAAPAALSAAGLAHARDALFVKPPSDAPRALRVRLASGPAPRPVRSRGAREPARRLLTGSRAVHAIAVVCFLHTCKVMDQCELGADLGKVCTRADGHQGNCNFASSSTAGLAMDDEAGGGADMTQTYARTVTIVCDGQVRCGCSLLAVEPGPLCAVFACVAAIRKLTTVI